MSDNSFPWKVGKAIWSENPDDPGIKEAYFRIDGPSGYVWLSATELSSRDTSVLNRISIETGATMLLDSTRNALRKLAEKSPPSEKGIVAAIPGWHGDSFIFGDGDVCTISGKARVDFVVLRPLQKFMPHGRLLEWKALMSPFIARQPLPYFACALGLCGPLYHFLDGSVENAQVELVGEAGSGKSTVGMLAASIWCGDLVSREGGAETWKMTLNEYDRIRLNHRGMFLMLDEAEAHGNEAKDRSEIVRRIVMQSSQSRGKRRLTDRETPPVIRIPLLSTTNTSLHQLLSKGNSASRDAAMQRMMSIYVTCLPSDRGCTVFDELPAGYDRMETAVQGLQRAVGEAYGSAGRAFVHGLARLAASGEEALRERLRQDIDRIRDRLFRLDETGNSRHRGMLATVEVAASLAREFDVFPSEWGDPSRIIDFVYGQCTASAQQQRQSAEIAYRRFAEYLRENVELGRTLCRGHIATGEECHSSPIAIRMTGRGGIAYLLPAYFRETFPSPHGFLGEMKKLGKLIRHESERGDRLQVRAPAQLRCYGFDRVYAIELDKEAMSAVQAACRKLPKFRREKRRR